MFSVNAFACRQKKAFVQEVLSACDAFVYTDWTVFEQKAARASVLVCLADAPFGIDTDCLKRLRHANPTTPIAIWTQRRPALDPDLRIHAFTDLRRLRRSLPSYVREQLFAAARAHALEVIQNGDHHLRSMRVPIADWLAAERVPRLVNSAAGMVDTPLATLEKLHRTEIGAIAGTSLKRCLDSIVLFRVCELLARKQTLEATAAHIGCSSKTIRRMGRRAWGLESTELLKCIAPDRALSLLLRSLGLADERAPKLGALPRAAPFLRSPNMLLCPSQAAVPEES